MSYTYTTFQKALALEMIVPNANTTDPNFIAILPTIIDYAEQRCYRELDCLHAETRQWFPMTANQREQSYLASASVLATPSPAQQILIVERVSVQPVTTAIGTLAGEPVRPVTIDYIDAIYSGLFGAAGPIGRPQVFAPLDDQTLVFGETPDQAYYFVIHGKCRPVPLYAATPPVGGNPGDQTTFLTSVLPDLFLAAAMVAASGYRHNFGAQADDPRMAVSWESQYNELLASAKNEETRKRFLGWSMMSSYSSTQAAQPAPAPAG